MIVRCSILVRLIVHWGFAQKLIVHGRNDNYPKRNIVNQRRRSTPRFQENIYSRSVLTFLGEKKRDVLPVMEINHLGACLDSLETRVLGKKLLHVGAAGWLRRIAPTFPTRPQVGAAFWN
jgi:hypothetical protein